MVVKCSGTINGLKNTKCISMFQSKKFATWLGKIEYLETSRFRRVHKS